MSAEVSNAASLLADLLAGRFPDAHGRFGPLAGATCRRR